ncbi:hypothetical protein SAMN05216359_11879 [Roseateles sp. YR242]|uniref:hypothetical protein n=1 Tax=Roseateles sp. YR242 TaxID=1855305 RepID=UPI0008C05C45|nr:hypothetical protein [Roseateles sp. YR242]SEL82893.1 hypothetical protein SAMN05216359_11879 [Roseateles sp. YR242]
MTLAARIETAVKIQSLLKEHAISVDPVRLACDADYASAMEQACLQIGQLDECLHLLNALVDTIVLSGLPTREEEIRLGDVHPEFADTVASDLMDIDLEQEQDVDIDVGQTAIARSHRRVRTHFQAGIDYLRQDDHLNTFKSSPELLAAFVVASAAEVLAKALTQASAK